jgi:lysozyme
VKTIPNQIITQLIRDEGKRYEMYIDSVGVPTIGIGHNLNDPISDASINQILQDDLISVEIDLQEYLPWLVSLDDVRYGAMINLCFNMGIKRLLEFKLMLLALQINDFNEAANQLLNSVYANEVGDRAKRLAQQFITGIWQ